MKLMVRAHDLGVKGADNINNRICELGLDGVQLVAYKSIDGVSYSPCSLSSEQAKEIGSVIRKNEKEIALIGAYFNPVHPNTDKISNGIAVFKDYLTLAKCLGCDFVGSETGSYNGDPWIYHPMNHSDEALDRVVNTFGELADYAGECGVNIAMEGAFGHVCHTPERLALAVSRIGRDNIGIIFDNQQFQFAIGNCFKVFKLFSRFYHNRSF